MGMIEFNAKVKDGKIEIPTQYRTKIKDQVRVILFTEREESGGKNLIHQLLASPMQIKGFSPLKRDDLYER
jgi:hypothetical protein